MKTVLVLLVVGAFLFATWTIPAIGGPQALSSANPVRIAKKALKRAKKADRTARSADRKAVKALALLKGSSDFLKPPGFLDRREQTTTIPAGQSAIGVAECSPDTGAVLLSGGFSVPQRAAYVIFSHPIGNGWHVGVDNTAGTTDATVNVRVICAKVGKAIAVAASKMDAAARREDQKLIRERNRAFKNR